MNLKLRYIGILVLLCFLGGAYQEMSAQVPPPIETAQVKVTNKPYSELTSWTYYTTGYVYGSTYLSIPLPSGFNFYYDGQLMRYFTMSGSVGLRMSPTTTYYSTSFYPVYTLQYDYFHYTSYNRYGGGFLYPFWAYNYYNYGAGPVYTMRMFVSGTAPNRVATFEWRGFSWLADYEATALKNVQVKLYEGSNSIEFHYGDMNRGTTVVGSSYNNYNYYWRNAMIGLIAYYPSTSPPTNRYINLDPNGNGSAGLGWEAGRASAPLSRGYTYYGAVRTNADFDNIQKGECVTFSYGPNMVNTKPTSDVNLRRGYVYGNGTTDPGGYGNDQRPSVTLNNITGGATIRRQIQGPISYPANPNYQTIYDATESVVNNVLMNFDSKTTLNNNIAFGNLPANPDGCLDLDSYKNNISGGIYRVFDDITHNSKLYNNEYFINIANEWDLLIRRPVTPKSYKEYVYAAGEPIPFKIKIANKGLNNIKKLYILVDVYNSSDEIVHHDSIHWKANVPSEELRLGDEIDIEMKSWNTIFEGMYKLKAYAHLDGEQESFNNYWAWLGSSDFYFKVAPETEAETNKILNPTDMTESDVFVENTIGRPVRPRIRYRNNGKNDISDAPTNLTIKHIPTQQVVYSKKNIKVTSIPFGLEYNTIDWQYDYFTPTLPGQYEITASVNVLEDNIDFNNELKDTFTVIDPLIGTYTIGPIKNTGNHTVDSLYNSRNFTTIQAAVDALYWKGVGAPVVFELTTTSYHVGNIEGIGPALEFRSKIEGVSPQNTITFKPLASLGTSEASVVINLYSPSGIGIMFGQSIECFNQYAIINSVTESIRKDFTSPTGNVIFDGGKQRSLKFLLHSTSELNAVFYLSQGASNITIKNCVINSPDPSATWNDITLPNVNYVNPTYAFERDWKTLAGTQYGYSAGIVMRSIAPMDEIGFWFVEYDVSQTGNRLFLDTLMNSNNVLSNNKINGFAYGIVSLGIGSCIVSGTGQHTMFYNHDNIVSNNIITNCTRSGIFFGNEKNSIIRGNKIYGIASNTTGYYGNYDVAGIMIGGERTESGNLAYSNVGLIVDGNEISNIGEAMTTPGQNNFVYGIKIEQGANAFGTNVVPYIEEDNLIKNNIIWGLRPGAADVNKVGIRLFAERNFSEPNWLNRFYTPLTANYFTRKDKIFNNTIIMGNDGLVTTGIVVPIMIQNALWPVVMNNAVSLEDNNGGPGSNIYTGIYYQGLLPGKAGCLSADRNVFYLNAAGDDHPSLYLFTEIDTMSNIINIGTRNDFPTLNQWQMFSGFDTYTVLDDFRDELTSPSINEWSSKLRITNNPAWPKGSKLNNRGENLLDVLSDADGNTRGLAAQRYDIGAIEFPGIMLTTDAEISSVKEPGSYRSTSSTYSDAEYVMTEAPVDVKAVIRNNGALQQNGMNVFLKIYREKPDAPGTFYTTPELLETVSVNLESNESGEISFNLGDLQGQDFYPLSYGDWQVRYEDTDKDPDSLYTIPVWYTTMANNVTPLYKIVISLQSDEEIANNTSEKIVRFYIRKSALGLLITAENSFYSISGPESQDIKAGKRNYDSLVAGFANLGWVNGWDKTGEFPILKQYFDVFERTAWEPMSVNYDIYKTVFWSDADENTMTRRQREDIDRFIASGKETFKKNLVIGSQEMLRINYNTDSVWAHKVLNAKRITVNPTDPNAGAVYATQDNASRYIIGETLERNLPETILKTMASPADADPIPALMSIYTESEGLTRAAYNFNEPSVICPNPKVLTAGTANVSIWKNVVYIGIDWRHFGTMGTVMRGIIDFLNKNGGSVIPVELVSFGAKLNDNRVELSWETAGEINSSLFEVEKAEVNASGYGSFVKIGEEKAAGKSNKLVSYGPVVDKNIANGNTYAYRLKMIDLDGKFNYSNVVEVTIGDNGSIILSDAKPNPATGETTLEYTLSDGGFMLLAIYDLSGKNVMTIINGSVSSGSYVRNIDVSSLPSGYYNIVMNFNGSTVTRQLRIVR